MICGAFFVFMKCWSAPWRGMIMKMLTLKLLCNRNFGLGQEDAIKEICKLGFSEAQAMAVCDYPLNALCGLRKDRMSEIILRHERIVSCLEKLAV